MCYILRNHLQSPQMTDKFISRLRNLAAILITLSGIVHIAALWLRELNGAALADALLGAVYLTPGK